MPDNGKTALHYFIEHTAIQYLLWTLSHKAPWKATIDRFMGPQKQNGRGMINNDNLACFQIHNSSYQKASDNFVAWAVKPTWVLLLTLET